jgi:hypothetical protein
MMRISIRFAAVLMAVALIAAASTPSYDYYVSLYQRPTAVLPDGRKVEQVIVYLGNNAFTGAAPTGPPFNIVVKVRNAAGQEVCTATGVQLDPIPTGKAWGAYAFQVIHPKPVAGKGVKGLHVDVATRYDITAMVSPEHPDADNNRSNNYVSQSFNFIAGGTASCETLPRPTFH